MAFSKQFSGARGTGTQEPGFCKYYRNIIFFCFPVDTIFWALKRFVYISESLDSVIEGTFDSHEYEIENKTCETMFKDEC